MHIGIPRETRDGETRVAATPETVKKYVGGKHTVVVERGAGTAARYLDEAYAAAGATLGTAQEALGAELVMKVRAPSAAELPQMKPGSVVIGMLDPFDADGLQQMAAVGLVGFALEAAPRITRAQSLDVLSSQANLAGYKAVLLAAHHYGRLIPMMMTAAGTLKAARAVVLGTGVAGLQAIATAKRLGAKVEAYDVRPAVAEQVESLGGKFVELDLETGGAEDKGGYAKAQGEEFYKRQRELMAEVVARNDVCITTAAIPGRKSPLLVIEDAVKRMAPGSVIVDMASERGGNCELTRHGETIVAHDVTIMGPDNLPSTVPYHASQMYSKNISSLLLHLVDDGALKFDTEDEITAGTLLCRDGAVVHERVKGALAPKGD